MVGCGSGSRAPCPGAQCRAARLRPGGGGPQRGRPVGGGAPQLGAARSARPSLLDVPLFLLLRGSLCLTFSLSLSGPSVPLSTPPPTPAPCLLSHFPLSGSLFLHLPLFPPVSLSPLFPFSLWSHPPGSCFLGVCLYMSSLKSQRSEGYVLILASAVPGHQGTLERASPLLRLHVPTCKMERQLGGASRGLWALMRE